ncbi:MAG: hypothetical protein GX123_08450 [Clostridiales bacterium]|jgi:hypothetical protein|nr:hypothetical protein [Clostridiales bacterium]
MKRLAAAMLTLFLLLMPSFPLSPALAEEYVSGEFRYSVNADDTVTLTGFEGEWD